MRFENPNSIEDPGFNTEGIVDEVIAKAGSERGRALFSVLKNVLKEKGLVEKSSYDWVDTKDKTVVDLESFLEMFNKISEQLPIIKIESDPDAEIDFVEKNKNHSKHKPTKKYWWEDKD